MSHWTSLMYLLNEPVKSYCHAGPYPCGAGILLARTDQLTSELRASKETSPAAGAAGEGALPTPINPP